MWLPILREKPSIIESFSKLSYTAYNFRGLCTREEGSLCIPAPLRVVHCCPVLSAKPNIWGVFIWAALHTCASDRITLSSIAFLPVADDHYLILGTESRAWAGFWLSASSRWPLTISHVISTRASQHRRVSSGSSALVSMLRRPCEPLPQGWGSLSTSALLQRQITAASYTWKLRSMGGFLPVLPL